MARKGSNIYKRKDGRYEGRVPIGYKENGKLKYKSIYDRTLSGVKEKMIPDKNGLLFHQIFSLVSNNQVAYTTHKEMDDAQSINAWRAALLRDAVKEL